MAWTCTKMANVRVENSALTTSRFSTVRYRALHTGYVLLAALWPWIEYSAEKWTFRKKNIFLSWQLSLSVTWTNKSSKSTSKNSKAQVSNSGRESYDLPCQWGNLFPLFLLFQIEKKIFSASAESAILITLSFVRVTQDFRGRIHSPSFSSKLTNWPYKLDCYITLGWNSLSGTNTLVVGPLCKLKKWSVVNTHPGALFIFFVSCELAK